VKKVKDVLLGSIRGTNGKMKSVMFHRPDLGRTELIEEWYDMEKWLIEMNGSYEKLKILSTKETQKTLDTMTEDDYMKWKVKRGYTKTCLDIAYEK
jgi:hypothetical protein